MFLMPFYLIQGQGLSPTQAGLILTAMPIVMAIIAPISGTLSDRYGTRIPTVLGMAILATGLVWLAGLGPQFQRMADCSTYGRLRVRDRHFYIPKQLSLNGICTAQSAGDRSWDPGNCAQCWHGVGHRSDRGDLHNRFGAPKRRLATRILFTALRTSFLSAAGVAIIGALITAIRSQDKIAET